MKLTRERVEVLRESAARMGWIWQPVDYERREIVALCDHYLQAIPTEHQGDARSAVEREPRKMAENAARAWLADYHYVCRKECYRPHADCSEKIASLADLLLAQRQLARPSLGAAGGGEEK